MPWAGTEGNHDGESGLSYAQVQEKLLSMDNTVQKPNPTFLGKELYGHTNFWQPVQGPVGTSTADTNLLTLYFIDSNAYSPDPDLSGGGYDWVHLDQIEWFANESASIKATSAARGQPQPPALLWQHIPLPQHKTWQDGGSPIVGDHHEPVCSPNIDTGALAAYGAAGDVKAVTVGHDHTNDWCSSEPVEGVYLCYDGHAGYGASGYGRPDYPIRARIFRASRFGGVIESYKHLDTLCGGCADGATPILDLQLIYGDGAPLADVAVSLSAGTAPSCPPGYRAVHTDLNKGAGGSYSYLCLLHSDGKSQNVVQSVGVAEAPVGGAQPACEDGWTRVPANLKEGSSASVVQNLCLFLAPGGPGTEVVVNVAVAQGAGAACAEGMHAVTGDISAGVGLPEKLCVKSVEWSVAMAERAAAGAGGRGAGQAGWSAGTGRAASKADV